MIYHRYAFNGPYWDFPESPAQGLYARPLVYEMKAYAPSTIFSPGSTS
jgi:hypothetical protein